MPAAADKMLMSNRMLAGSCFADRVAAAVVATMWRRVASLEIEMTCAERKQQGGYGSWLWLRSVDVHGNNVKSMAGPMKQSGNQAALACPIVREAVGTPTGSLL